MQLLANPISNDAVIVSGESGAVPIGFLQEICTNQRHRLIKEELSLDNNSRVLIFSTEGDTDPKNYQEYSKL